MAKKHWIYIKRGLSEDPKHRSQMGECIWLYMHIIDRADWETGIAYDWKDREEAAEMGMSHETLRDQRQKLERLDYIRCDQKQRGQDIKIMEWRNPREYGSEVKNPRIQGDPSPSPSEFQGDAQGDAQELGRAVTPTLDSESLSSSNEKISFDEERADVTWAILGGRKITQKQLDKQKALKDFEDMLEQQFKRFPLNWIAFDENAKENFRRFLKDAEEGQTLEKFVNWWMSDERRASTPPYTLAIVMQRWPQAFAGKQKKAQSPAEPKPLVTPFTQNLETWQPYERPSFDEIRAKKKPNSEPLS